MKSPPAATLYRFIPAARHQEFKDNLDAARSEPRLKSAEAPTLARFFELKVPQREPGFFKWFSYVAEVICAAWANRERIDNRKLVLRGMKSVLNLRLKTIAGFEGALDPNLKSLRDRLVTELAADTSVNIGDLAEALAEKLDRVNVNVQGSPYLVAEDMSQTDRAAQIERDSELREANSRPSSPQLIDQAMRELAAALQAPKDAMLDTETQQVPSNLPDWVVDDKTIEQREDDADPGTLRAGSLQAVLHAGVFLMREGLQHKDALSEQRFSELLGQAMKEAGAGGGRLALERLEDIARKAWQAADRESERAPFVPVQAPTPATVKRTPQSRAAAAALWRRQLEALAKTLPGWDDLDLGKRHLVVRVAAGSLAPCDALSEAQVALLRKMIGDAPTWSS